MNTTPSEKWTTAKWTTADVCAHYRVTARTVKNLRDRGVLPAIKITARLIRFDPVEVEAAFRK